MIRLLVGHVLDKLAEIPAESIHCCVTSPPYYGLRDYGLEPQAWGGEPACRHDFQIEEVAAYSSKGNWQQAANDTQLVTGIPQTRHKGDLNSAREKADSKIERGFCRHCNAWQGSLGLEPILDLYLNHMTSVCREIRRVLRKDGTFWLNISDSYAGGGGGNYSNGTRNVSGQNVTNVRNRPDWLISNSLKPKDLMLIPSRLAIRLQDDGWWVRSEIVWAKDSPMPESVTDRPTSAHEKIFLLTKSARYYYDAEAVKEDFVDARQGADGGKIGRVRNVGGRTDGYTTPSGWTPNGNTGRNLRNVWRLSTSPFPDAHFATFPPELPRRCINAGTSDKGVCPKCGTPWARIIKKSPLRPVRGNYLSQISDNHKTSGSTEIVYNAGKTMVRTTEGWSLLKRDAETIGWRPMCRCQAGDPVPATVLDPFAGSGTTLLVADQLQRNAIGIELNPTYANMAANRATNDAPLLTTVLTDNANADDAHPQLL